MWCGGAMGAPCVEVLIWARRACARVAGPIWSLMGFGWGLRWRRPSARVALVGYVDMELLLQTCLSG